MRNKTILYHLIVLLTTINVFAQKEPQLTVTFLANDKISKVNVDEGKFIDSFKKITDLTNKEFADISENQKIALLMIFHKTGKPIIELYSNPKINVEKQTEFLKKLNKLDLENTKLVDFPMLISINSKLEDIRNDFKDLVIPTEKKAQEYQNANLKQKYELNKKYAVQEVLPVLAAYQTIVEDKFVGVKNFGALITKTDFNISQDITILTSGNSDFWRAGMEMELGNQLVPITKIFALVSQGEFDHALKYIEIVRMFSSPKTYANDYLIALTERLKLFNEELNTEIQKGIEEHDKGEFEKAIGVYSEILKSYPNSAWTNYELFYSQNALDVKTGKVDLNNRESWDKSKITIYKHNPLYNMDVRANSGKEGYLLFRRHSINDLFKSKEEKLNDVYKYADIAMDLGVYDFAAQLFWYSFSYDKNTVDSLPKFLYCLEKLNVKTLKENFKGNFKKEFEKIDEEKEKEMTSSEIYKSFKK